jgi:hypothetical protein
LQGVYIARGLHCKGFTLQGVYIARGLHCKGFTLQGVGNNRNGNNRNGVKLAIPWIPYASSVERMEVLLL